MLLLEEVVADEERPQVAREVLVTGDGVSGDARERQSEEALPEDREVVVEEILERPVVGRRLVVRRREPERVVQRRLASGVRAINVRARPPTRAKSPSLAASSICSVATEVPSNLKAAILKRPAPRAPRNGCTEKARAPHYKNYLAVVRH